MIPFQTKNSLVPGTNYKEVYKHALEIFKIIKHKTKRKPFIRSVYFKNKPDSMTNPNKKSEILHRFAGLSADKQPFYVQIKEDKKGQKQLISIFPEK